MEPHGIQDADFKYLASDKAPGDSHRLDEARQEH